MAEKTAEHLDPSTGLIEWVNLTTTTDSYNTEFNEVWKTMGIDIVGES